MCDWEKDKEVIKVKVKFRKVNGVISVIMIDEDVDLHDGRYLESYAILGKHRYDLLFT